MGRACGGLNARSVLPLAASDFWDQKRCSEWVRICSSSIIFEINILLAQTPNEILNLEAFGAAFEQFCQSLF
jgi:hypothetical protein